MSAPDRRPESFESREDEGGDERAPIGRPLRVLAYSDSVAYGGAEAFFVRIVSELAREQELDVTAAVASENRALADQLRSVCRLLTTPGQPVRLGAFHLFDPRRRRAVARLLESEPWDAVFVNLPSAEYGSTPLLETRRRNLPTVGLLHVHQSFRALEFHAGAARDRLAGRAMRGLDALLALSEPAADTASRLWLRPGASVRVVPMPRPEVRHVPRDEARTRLGLPSGLVIGLAGRVSIRQKGFDTFLAAARALTDGGLQATFAIAGEGPDDEALRRLVRDSGVEANVRLLGPVRPIDDFLGALDVLVIPSRFEGIPLIALEALAAGVLGVASAVDGLPSVWPASLLVPPDDPAALAAKLREFLLLPSAERTGLLEQARRRLDEITATAPGAAVADMLLTVARSSSESAEQSL